MGKLVFGSVYGPAEYRHNATASGNPRPTVVLVHPGGHDSTTRTWSADAADAYGADNPERRDKVHAYRTTSAGRLASIDHDATNAYHYLRAIYRPGMRVSVLTENRGAGSSWPVRVLTTEQDDLSGFGGGPVVVDVSWAVAMITEVKRRERDGALMVPGGGEDPAHHVVRRLSSVLFGEPDALTLARV